MRGSSRLGDLWKVTLLYTWTVKIEGVLIERLKMFLPNKCCRKVPLWRKRRSHVRSDRFKGILLTRYSTMSAQGAEMIGTQTPRCHWNMHVGNNHLQGNTSPPEPKILMQYTYENQGNIMIIRILKAGMASTQSEKKQKKRIILIPSPTGTKRKGTSSPCAMIQMGNNAG